MSHWQSKPDSSSRTENYRIYRTPVGKEVELICLSENFLGAKLHYWKGRSTPCSGTGCEACKNGQRPRWKGYILAYHMATKTVVIFEFTERGYEPMEEALIRHKRLRGMKFKTFRLNKKTNGPIQLSFSELREESPHLPKAGDLAAMLERIWEVRQPTFDFEAKSSEDSAVTGRILTAVDRNGAVRDPDTPA